MTDILLVLLILSMVLFVAMLKRETVSAVRARFTARSTQRRGSRGLRSQPR